MIEGFRSMGKEFLAVSLSENLLDIIYEYDNINTYAQYIDVDCVKVGAVKKIFFLCPVTGLYCSEMIFKGPLWASRRGHGLQARNGTPQQRRRRRQLKLRNEVQDRYWRPGVHRSTRKRLAAEIDEQLRRDG